MSSIIVFGATGITGLAALGTLISTSPQEWDRIYAVSRRTPALSKEDPRVKHASVDLLGSVDDIATALKKADKDEDKLIEVNEKLFRNSLDALIASGDKLDVVLLQTGYKCEYYGVHKGGGHLARYPFKEDAPRHKGGNFYFVQEDMLKEHAEKHRYHWVITRPNFIVGQSKCGYARTIRRTSQITGQTPRVPRLRYHLWPRIRLFELKAQRPGAQVYLLTHKEAYDEAYNLHDGRCPKWGEIWEKTAAYFQMEPPGPPSDKVPAGAHFGSEVVPLHSVTESAKSNKQGIDEMYEQYGLDPAGKDHATWDFLDFTTCRTWADKASLEKLKGIGYDSNFDTWEDGFKAVFDGMRKDKVIP